MDLRQRKLSKDEWKAIEVKLPSDEISILRLFSGKEIESGYPIVSLADKAHIDPSPGVLAYLYSEYFAAQILKLCKKYGIAGNKTTKPPQASIKTADKIRLKNLERTLMSDREAVFEFVVVDLFAKALRLHSKGESWVKTFYTACVLSECMIKNKVPGVVEFVDVVRKTLEPQVDLFQLVINCSEFIERNKDLDRFRKKELYDHQKSILSHIKLPNPKLIFYTAPTGTGKTLTPIGIVENKRVIFVCAARHVGLALAKAAVSMEKRIAFAFGCNDASDIRLHYFSAKEYTKNYKSGGIFKVDNSVGDNVEMMICDLQSYLPAMHYMMAFNKPEDLVLYWDEPTISLDYQEHDLHSLVGESWAGNQIPNVVLSSATLPCQKSLQQVTSGFKDKFPSAHTYEISSYNCSKSIAILGKDSVPVLPHIIFDDYADVKRSCIHCTDNKSLMRYLDTEGIGKFIQSANEMQCYKDERFVWSMHFESLKDITLENIKKYYLLLLGNIDQSKWDALHRRCCMDLKPRYPSCIRLATEDAHTLTDGPAIFIADDVERVGKFCLQSARIPRQVIEELGQAISFNNSLNDKIGKIEKDIDTILQKDADKDAKKAESRVPPEVRQLQDQLDALRGAAKVVKLHDMFVPNTRGHMDRWVKGTPSGIPFCPDVSSADIEKIMLINDIEDIWKILLMMGIGVFKEHKSVAYSEIMKRLAQDQKLYLVIASGDYIYGTNYQFCHGYLGQDVCGMSQEKLIQAIGRVGRKAVQKDYTVRLRDDTTSKRLFLPAEESPEAFNMNKLLGPS